MKTILFNPFEKYSDTVLLISGLSFSIIGIFLAFTFNARFDGFIDLHFTEKTSISQTILDLLINIGTGTIVFFIIGKSINPKTRIIDMLSTCLIAKIPFYIITFININGLMYKTTSRIIGMIKPEQLYNIPKTDLMTLMIASIITIFALIWAVILLFNGFKIATNAKETKHTFLFIAGIIISEVLSKILIHYL